MTKFAIVKLNGKQYKFDENSTVVVDGKFMKEGESLEVKGEDILCVCDGEKILDPSENASLKLEVIDTFRDKKLVVFKKRRRKHYKKTQGHRQDKIKLLAKEIIV